MSQDSVFSLGLSWSGSQVECPSLGLSLETLRSGCTNLS